MDNEIANDYSQKANKAPEVVLVNRLKETAQKKCYVCDVFGHSVQVCPTAPVVRNIASLTSLPKLKRCITVSIGNESQKFIGYQSKVVKQTSVGLTLPVAAASCNINLT